jgi:hypothetical protein
MVTQLCGALSGYARQALMGQGYTIGRLSVNDWGGQSRGREFSQGDTNQRQRRLVVGASDGRGDRVISSTSAYLFPGFTYDRPDD